MFIRCTRCCRQRFHTVLLADLQLRGARDHLATPLHPHIEQGACNEQGNEMGETLSACKDNPDSSFLPAKSIHAAQ